jgi:hypothetical protein
MFVFGEVQDPNIETVNLVEDIVRSQLIELVRLFIFTMGPCSLSHCNLLDCPGASFGHQTGCALSQCRGSHIPYPARQREGESFADVPFLERCAETRKRLWWRWRRGS